MILGVTTIPAHALVLRRRPEDLGLFPDGEPPEPDRPLSPPEGVPLSRALRDPAYWWLTVAFFLGTVASVAIGLYLIPVLLERGESLARATVITGLIGAAQVGGRDRRHRARPAGAGGGDGSGGLRPAGGRIGADPPHVRVGDDCCWRWRCWAWGAAG